MKRCDMAMTECSKCCRGCKEVCDFFCIFAKRNQECDHEEEITQEE